MKTLHIILIILAAALLVVVRRFGYDKLNPPTYTPEGVEFLDAKDYDPTNDTNLVVDQNGRGGSDTITDQNPIRNDTTKQREGYKKAEGGEADYITLKDGKKIAEYSKEEVQADIDFLRDYLERNSDQ